MARKIAAGNWKMNGTGANLAELESLAQGVAQLDRPADLEVLICPPAPLIARAADLVAGRIIIGGQDCHAENSGAHTGDISAAMLRDAGADAVILGHSERRSDHGESDAQVRAKTVAAQKEALCAIVCIGETLAQREAGEALDVVRSQLAGSLPDTIDAAHTVIAYEPVWAIGTGKVPTSAQIAEVHDLMRTELAARYGAETAASIPLLYGGSVKASNAQEIFATSNVDGALVGGASLKAADFLPVVAALGAH